MNLPIGVATAALAAQRVPGDEGIGLARGADAPGAVLIVSALMLGVYTIVEATNYGWVSTRTLGLGAIAIALLVSFIIREARTSNPLVPLRLGGARRGLKRGRGPSFPRVALGVPFSGSLNRFSPESCS